MHFDLCVCYILASSVKVYIEHFSWSLNCFVLEEKTIFRKAQEAPDLNISSKQV